MSIVPYNSNKQIVYLDSSKGILIIHNDTENTFDLVRDTNRLNKRDRSRRCPNCGYRWHRQSDSEPQSPLLEPIDEGLRLNDGISESEHHDMSPNFTHQDYFKLLASLPEMQSEESGKSYNYSTRPTSLPESIFNQGYFEKFFKKIPPYTLGSGAHAEVFKVIHVLNDILLGAYAVKRICIGDQLPLLQQVLNEVAILYELSVQGANENNLIQYNHVWMEMGDITEQNAFIVGASGQTKSGSVPFVYILQQYCDGGHLEDLINHYRPETLSLKEKIEIERKKRRQRRKSSIHSLEKNESLDSEISSTESKKNWLDEIEILKFFLDIVNGVLYLHNHGILHRDLKPLNCLLETDYQSVEVDQGFNMNCLSYEALDLYYLKLPKVLVSDFGEGQFINKRKQILKNDENYERRGNTGTLEFTSPELWIYDHPDHLMNDFTFESDIYSLGLILCWLCLGQLPFSNIIEEQNDPEKIRDLILDWYFSIQKEEFDEWYISVLKSQGRYMSPQLETFKELIFEIIKPEQGEYNKKISMEEILRILEEIKWSFVSLKNKKEDDNSPRVDGSKKTRRDSHSLLNGAQIRDLKAIFAFLCYTCAFFVAEYSSYYNVRLYFFKFVILVIGIWEIRISRVSRFREIRGIVTLSLSLWLMYSTTRRND